MVRGYLYSVLAPEERLLREYSLRTKGRPRTIPSPRPETGVTSFVIRKDRNRGKEREDMEIMERSETSILQRNLGIHCSSEFCEKCPFVTLNQQAVDSSPALFQNS
jgi:hypothetical protein